MGKKKKKQVEEIKHSNVEEDLFPKKPKKSIKPITEKEWELNKHWYESDECSSAVVKYYSDDNGILINNPLNPKLVELIKSRMKI